MDRPRTLVIAALLLAAGFAGCVAPGLSPAATTPGSGAVRESPLEFSGELAPMESVDLPFEVPADALFVELGIAFVESPTPFSAPVVTLLDADGEVVRVPEPFNAGGLLVTRRLIEDADAAFGEWTLHLRASRFTTLPVGYTVTGVVAAGEVPAAAVFTPTPPAPVTGDRVVVAVVDTGINMYHEAFRSATLPVPDAVDARTGEGARDVPVTLLGHERMVDGPLADDALWRGVERGQLYRFPGTRLLGISFMDEDRADPYPVLDDHGHGTATAATVLQQHPDAEIVMLKVSGFSWNEIADAIEWAAEQPWIDVISVSMGNPANLPVIAEAQDNRMPTATRKAVDAGKVYIESAGNDPTLTYTDNSDGPPWVITVSGAEPSSRSRDVLPSYGGVDFVSDFSVLVASHTSLDGTRWIQGTSFSCPATAGSFARALHDVRRATGHVGGMTPDGLLVDTPQLQLDRAALLDAMSRAAVYWDATEYSPQRPPGEEPMTQVLATGTPFLPGAPWLTTGWGYVNATAGEAAAKHVLGIEELPEKPAGAKAWMEAQHAVRSAIWE